MSKYNPWCAEIKPSGAGTWWIQAWCSDCGEFLEELFESERDAITAAVMAVQIFGAVHQCRQLQFF